MTYDRFYPSEAKAIAEKIVADTFNEELKDQTYDEDYAADWSTSISDKIRDAVTANLNIPRYKVVVQTTIGQMRDQGIRVASRCLWDVSRDNYASCYYTNVRVL